jgi:hypothetical protein
MEKMEKLALVTAAEAGINGDEQVKIALQTIANNGGMAQMQQIYAAVNENLKGNGYQLSKQGEASLRFYVNRVAVKAGYIYPHDKKNPGWRITPQGREFLDEISPEPETVVNVDTQAEEEALPNIVRGTAFELYILEVLKAVYPYYVWYYQGSHKKNERGLDFIGDRIGDSKDEPKSIGVQVKFHEEKYAPTQLEWLKFLSGCFARRVESAIFITTGRLSGEQRREAREANVIVIEGRQEVTRLAKLYKIAKFDLFS